MGQGCKLSGWSLQEWAIPLPTILLKPHLWVTSCDTGNFFKVNQTSFALIKLSLCSWYYRFLIPLSGSNPKSYKEVIRLSLSASFHDFLNICYMLVAQLKLKYASGTAETKFKEASALPEVAFKLPPTRAQILESDRFFDTLNIIIKMNLDKILWFGQNKKVSNDLILFYNLLLQAKTKRIIYFKW